MHTNFLNGATLALASALLAADLLLIAGLVALTL
jgi:hypothetical protein